MAPTKNKNKINAPSKSTSEAVVLGKKQLQKGEKAGIASESTAEEVVSNNKIMEDKMDGDAKEPVPTPKVRKSCTWLKLDRLDPQIGSKTSLQTSKQGKEAKFTTQVEVSKDNKRKRKENGEEKAHNDPIYEKRIDSHREKKEKETVSNRHKETKKDEESGKILGGLIFMCNAKTKPDCFRYQVMGVSANKKEVVMNIKPGLKIFLYDYDLKLMYGVYEALSAGGMKLEPAAFGGAFPAQVRFIVHKDCFPLPESVFKKAMKDGYDERTHKFKTELTIKQVKDLIYLFHPTPLLRPNGKSAVQESTMSPVPPTVLLNEESFMRERYPNNYSSSDTRRQPVPLHHDNQIYDTCNAVPPQDPLFLTEQEYRSNSLRLARHLLPTTAGDNVSHSWEPNKLDIELKQLLRNPGSTSIDSAVRQREVTQRDHFFLSEEEFQIYGLRGPQHVRNAAHPMMKNDVFVRDPGKDAWDPYDESTTSLVNRYLALPMTTAVPAESYPLAGRVPYIDDLNLTSDITSHPASTITDGERAFVSYNLHEHSVFNQRSYSLNGSHEASALNLGTSVQRETNERSAPVTKRYSFAGPTLSRHR